MTNTAQVLSGKVTRIAVKTNREGHEYLGITVQVNPSTRAWFGRPTEMEAGRRGLVVLREGDKVSGTAEVSGTSDDGGMVFLKNVRLDGDPEPTQRNGNGGNGGGNAAIPLTGPLPVGTFTVSLKDGGYRTLKIGTPVTNIAEFRGWQFIKFLNGPDNTADFTNFAFRKVDTNTVQIKARFRDDSVLANALRGLLTADPNERHAMGVAYAQASGNCYICGRELTVPASIYSSVGPTCAAKYGVPYNDPPEDFEEDMTDDEYDAEQDWEGPNFVEFPDEAAGAGLQDEEDEAHNPMLEPTSVSQYTAEAMEAELQAEAELNNEDEEAAPAASPSVGFYRPPRQGVWTGDPAPARWVAEGSDLHEGRLDGVAYACPSCGQPVSPRPHSSHVERDREGDILNVSYVDACGATLVILND